LTPPLQNLYIFFTRLPWVVPKGNEASANPASVPQKSS
jgi:hypothetical protein